MKVKKLLSTIAALAIAASSFAGLGITANAATEVYTQDFEGETHDFTFGGKADGKQYVGIDPSTTNNNTTNVIGVGSASGDANMTSGSLNVTNEYVHVNIDVKMDACAGGKSSNFALLGSQNTKSWLESNEEILTIAASASSNGYWDSITLNGIDIKEKANVSNGTANGESANWGLMRDTTGWLNLDAIIHFGATEGDRTVDVTLTRKSNSSVVYEGTIPFVDAATTKLDRIFAAAGKGYGGVFVDNIVVETLTPPSFTLSEEAVKIDSDNKTAEVTVSGLVGTISVATSDDKVATAEYNEETGKVTVTYEGDGAAVITVTATNDGIPVEKEIAVEAGAVTYTNVTVQFVNAENTSEKIADDIVINDVAIGSTIDLSEYTDDVTTYTNGSGTVYTATHDGIDVATVPVTADMTYQLKFDLAEHFTVSVVASTDNTVVFAEEQTVIEGKSISVSYPKYLTDVDKDVKDANKKVLASCNETTYTKTITPTESGVIEIPYTAYEGTAYFAEGEAINGNNAALGSANFSGGNSRRATNDGVTAFTIGETAYYSIEVAGACRNTANSSVFAVYKNSVADENLVFNGDMKGASQNNVQTNGIKVSEKSVLLKEGDVIILQGDNGQTLLDYILVEKTGVAPVIDTVEVAATNTTPATDTISGVDGSEASYAELTADKTVTTIYIKVDNAEAEVAPVVTFNEIDDPAQATYFTTADANGYFVYQVIADEAVTVKSVTYTGAADLVFAPVVEETPAESEGAEA